MDIKHLRYFVAIVEAGSMSGAASRIGVAQPSLSEHVKNLEYELGSELFTRTSKGVCITLAGEILLTRAEEILAAVESAKEEVRQSGTEPYGKVSFGLPSSVSMVLSVPLAEKVRMDLPKVNLRAVGSMSGFVRDWLIDKSIDMAVLYDINALNNMKARELMTEDLQFLSSPANWPLKTPPGEAVELRELASQELVLPSTNHGLRALIERFSHEHSIKLNVVLEMDSLAQIKMLVSRGSASTILAPASAQDYIEKGELVTAPIINPIIRRPVYLVRNPAKTSTRASREVETMAIHVIRDLVERGIWPAQLSNNMLEQQP